MTEFGTLPFVVTQKECEALQVKNGLVWVYYKHFNAKGNRMVGIPLSNVESLTPAND